MQLTLDHPGDIQVIGAHSEAGFQINGEWHAQTILISPDELQVNDLPQSLNDVDESFADRLIAMQPDLVVLGTGQTLTFPNMAFYGRLLSSNIGCEVMDTAAGCRTYNVLAGEARRVLALLMFEP